MRVVESALFQVLLDLRQSIVGESDLQTLYNATTELLRRIMSFDFPNLIVYNPC